MRASLLCWRRVWPCHRAHAVHSVCRARARRLGAPSFSRMKEELSHPAGDGRRKRRAAANATGWLAGPRGQEGRGTRDQGERWVPVVSLTQPAATRPGERVSQNCAAGQC